jgi:hypothetical protein
VSQPSFIALSASHCPLLRRRPLGWKQGALLSAVKRIEVRILPLSGGGGGGGRRQTYKVTVNGRSSSVGGRDKERRKKVLDAAAAAKERKHHLLLLSPFEDQDSQMNSCILHT